jgi:hypothetical protein
MSVEVLISTNSTILTLTIITKQDSIEKPTLVHMSSQTYTVGNANNLFWTSKELRQHKQEYHAY